MADTRPTPRPAKNLPAMNIGGAVDAVCKMTPRLKTAPAAAIRPHRLPRMSAKGAANKAPKNVPADRMDCRHISAIANDLYSIQGMTDTTYHNQRILRRG